MNSFLPFWQITVVLNKLFVLDRKSLPSRNLATGSVPKNSFGLLFYLKTRTIIIFGKNPKFRLFQIPL
jgi:hypothetical protein